MTATPTIGFLLRLSAKPGKGPELRALLQRGQALVAQEQGTLEWYAFQINETEYGIFDTFASEDARQAHHAGRLAQAIRQAAPDLLSKPPEVQPTRIVATKHEGTGSSA